MDCARNIITANFSGGGTSATTAPLWQWDYGQVLCVTGIEDLPAAFEVHFSTNRTGGVSTVAVGADGQVTIPNDLLTIGKNLNAWIYLSDAQGEGETEYSILIPVKARPMPETYDAEVSGEFDDVVRQVSEYAQTAQTAADNAGASASAAAASASEAAASASAAESAKTAAETAQGKAEDAQSAAETAAQTATEKAQQTAQDAAQAALDAGRAESAAQSAEAAQTGAESAKTDAETAAQGAAASASAASASATSAGQAATSAGQSATAAAGSATTAQGAAQTATTKAGEASASATAAAASETAAQTAQTAAETAAGTATAKAIEAAASATAAAQAAASINTPDSALSDTSTNAVQNKVITGEVAQLKNAIDIRCAEASDALSNGEYVFNVPFKRGSYGGSTGSDPVFSTYINTWSMERAYAVQEDLTISLDPSKGSYSGGYTHNVMRLNPNGTIKSVVGWITSDITVKQGDLILYEVKNQSGGSVEMPKYEVYKLHRFKTAWQKDVDNIEENVSAINKLVSVKIEATNDTVIENRFIQSNGNISPSTSAFNATDFINVSDIADDKITLSCTVFGNASAVFYDENKNVVAYINGTNASSYGITAGGTIQTFTITKPTGTKYVRLSAYKSVYTSPSDLYASGLGFGNLESRLSNVENTIDTASLTLADKKVLILGDSISTDAYGSYKKWVTDLIEEGYFTAENVNNISQHATGYVARYNGGDNRFIDRLSAVADKDSYDLVVIYGGTNDYIQNIPMGAVGGDADTDFIPAVKYLFEYAIQNFTQARICIISPTRTYATWVNQQNQYETDYFSKIREIAKDYCYPVLNLTEESGFCPYISTFRNMWTLLPEGYDIHDGVHPNAEYEKKYLAPMIKQFLKGLL